MTSPGINYETFNGGRNGRLLSDKVFTESVTGYRLDYSGGGMRCSLYPSGTLVVYAGSEWDFGSWAVDTPAMVVASLEHDVFCVLTNARVLPWSVRARGDKQFWNRLTEQGATVSRLWRVPGVMVYSQLVARWKDLA